MATADIIIQNPQSLPMTVFILEKNPVQRIPDEVEEKVPVPDKKQVNLGAVLTTLTITYTEDDGYIVRSILETRILQKPVPTDICGEPIAITLKKAADTEFTVEVPSGGVTILALRCGEGTVT